MMHLFFGVLGGLVPVAFFGAYILGFRAGVIRERSRGDIVRTAMLRANPPPIPEIVEMALGRDRG